MGRLKGGAVNAVGSDPSVGQDHEHDGGGEEVDAIKAGRIIHAVALDEEDRQRQHEHVVHGPFAEPFERV